MAARDRGRDGGDGLWELGLWGHDPVSDPKPSPSASASMPSRVEVDIGGQMPLDLGIQVQTVVVDLAQSLTTSAPTEETYLEALGWLRM